ncbi:hypothetical protein AA0113_g1288 [Alternaria arborescens]|uniref:6-phosphogluconate dehydrogenase NADP-binding domain-containing protein n=1 Tax=Alternaria arborescens TaxID=156630 RepID=A0A4Q4SPK9_9PLEO|nr:hypothetical protein AA0112_g4983 [Alternaria arborescens]RYO72236.1 hypothetical protein AA0113_g1288 [Alternaria arborescens]
MSTQEPLRLGWIGLGSMGLAMATNMQKHLKKHGLPLLKYWNRTISRGDSLKDIGGTPCPSIADLAQNCDVIFISVSDDTVLRSVTETILSSGSITSKTFVDTTTVHPTTTSTITNKFTSAGAFYIATPVFGATPLAVAGRLLVAVAGPPSAIELVLPFLENVIARTVIRVGSEPSQALLLKTTSNFITAGLMMLLSEAHVLAEKAGLPASVLESLVEENFGAYAHGVSKRLTSGSYLPAPGQAPSSGLELGIKDVGHGVSLAKQAGMTLGIGEMYLGAAEEAKAYGDEMGRRCDSSAVFGIVRKRAGLDFESDRVKERDTER